MRLRAISIPAVALLVAGLGVGARFGVPPSLSLRCAPGPARPYSTASTIDSLRSHGITVYRDVDPPCDSLLVASASNVVFAGPHENLLQADELVNREGQVDCYIGKRPLGRYADHPRRVFTFPSLTGEGFKADMGNVDCAISPAQGKAEQQVQRLRAALEAVASARPS